MDYEIITLGNLISARSGTLKEFQKTMNTLSTSEQALKNELQSTAPEKLWEWMEGEGIITQLFDFGKSEREIDFKLDLFTDKKTVASLFKELETKWEKHVKFTARTKGVRLWILFAVII